MGRPKGLRKDKATGKWYRTDEVSKPAITKAPKRRGRPKGSKKGPDGKWYMKGEPNAPDNSKAGNISRSVVAPAPVDSVPAEPVSRAAKAVKRDYYMRNDLLYYKNETYVVLGHANGIVHVQAVFNPSKYIGIPEGELL